VCCGFPPILGTQYDGKQQEVQKCLKDAKTPGQETQTQLRLYAQHMQTEASTTQPTQTIRYPLGSDTKNLSKAERIYENTENKVQMRK